MIRLSKKIAPLLALLLVTIALPNQAFALIDIGFESDPYDMSIYFLGLLFGLVGGVLPEAVGNTLVGELFRIFNSAVLSIGTMIVVYTVIMSTTNTAQQGEVMGRKHSSIWIPIRSAAGIAFLLPTSSGYSLLQILIMSIVLSGVDAGNKVYQVIIDTIDVGQGVNETFSVNDDAVEQTVQGIFDSLMCMEHFNRKSATEPGFRLPQNGIIEMYRDTVDGVPMVLFGISTVEQNNSAATYCGSFGPSTLEPGEFDLNSYLSTQQAAIEAAALNMLPAAREAVYESDPTKWINRDPITFGKRVLKGALNNTQRDRSALDRGGVASAAAREGWLMAGAYYFDIVKKSGGGNVTIPHPVERADAKTDNFTTARTQAYLSEVESNQDVNRGTLSNLGSSNRSEFQKIFSFVSKRIIEDFMGYLTDFNANEGAGDVIIALQDFGSSMIMATEWLFFASIAGIVLLVFFGCIGSGISSTCYPLLLSALLLSPIITIIMTMTWAYGVMLGIYIPLLPYIIFAFGGIAWLVLVTEAMIAAPVIAMGLVSPSAGELGKAAPAIILIVSIFLRPALMLIGLIAAIKVSNVAVGMINYGFLATVEASTGYIGLFGTFVVVAVYGTLILGIVKESFSLIYVIPDKITRWIGGQAEQSMAARGAQQLEQAQSQTAQATKGMVAGGTAAGQSIAQKGVQAYQKEQASKAAKKKPGTGVG